MNEYHVYTDIIYNMSNICTYKYRHKICQKMAMGK